jgi:hypothetical protein
MFHVKHYNEQTWELFHVKHMDIYTQKKWTDKPKGLSVHIPDLNKY